MDLFDMLTIKLTLPKRSAPTEKIGGNSIYKLLFRQTKIKATVKKSEFPGYFELETGLTPPLRRYLFERSKF